MKAIGNILALTGLILFVYTIVARFIGEKSVLGFSQVPLLEEGFTAVGVFSATACILLLAVIALLKAKE
ncbi:MAG: hypothetical protein U9R44_00515 [Candidatus Omnitrophota bacterium]|nr:hypothetical protein [Candidatus Omnitrophota bacterium]